VTHAHCCKSSSMQHIAYEHCMPHATHMHTAEALPKLSLQHNTHYNTITTSDMH
jgi:hypothetical protein